MANSLTTYTEIPAEVLISRVTQLHFSIFKVESLRPSKQVNSLFSQLVKLCIIPSSIDIDTLPKEAHQMCQSLIILCDRADNLSLFPYYENYIKLANIEYKILYDNGMMQPKKLAFVGSGPMPLTSIVLASRHLKSTNFDNYEIDDNANNLARKIVSSDAEFEKRMKFVTQDIMELGEKLKEYDCIFFTARVGMDIEDKVKIIQYIRNNMKEGEFLLVRSAKGTRAFLYPVVEEHDLAGFEVLSIFHPTNDVVNSVFLRASP